jgi:conjugative transfer pilus assembly protein TraH
MLVHTAMKKMVACVASAAVAIAPISANASWMTDFYDAAGAGSNVTPTQAISTSSMVGVSGGGITWRVPSKTLNPIQITPPSFSAGCNGIDAFLGGYSFVNKQAFVDALRNFGQAATGYFFMLALRSMAPEIAVTLDAINDMAQKINALGANSCQAAKLAVDSTVGKWFEQNTRDASGYAQAVGEFTDRFDAYLGMQSGGPNKIYTERYMQKYGKAQAAMTAADNASQAPAIDANLVRWLMRNAQISLSEDEQDLVMSIIGPQYIVKRPASDQEPVASGYGPSIEFAQLVGNPSQATESFKVYKCSDAAECLAVYESTQTHKSFSRLAQEAMESMVASIVAKTPNPLAQAGCISDPDCASKQTVLRLSSVPLYKVASLAATTSSAGAVANSMMADMAQYAGLDAAINFLNHYLTSLDRAVASAKFKLPEGFEAKAERIHERIAELRRQANEMQRTVYATRGYPFGKLDQLEKVERAMIGNLNVNLAANLRFSHRH